MSVTGRAAVGGGVYLDWWSSEIHIANLIVYSNTSGTVGYDNWKTNASIKGAFSNCCVIPTNSAYGVLPGTGNITNYPMFMDPMVNFRLTNGSPCVNSGTNQDWMTSANDLDSRPRIRYGIVDMGAYEYICKGTVVSMY